jgi:pimeloyl-ACP methyl ester carboxylesterase
MIAFSADGLPIAYRVHGAGAPLILLHGFTETSASWEEVGYIEPFLRAGRQVVLVDARGHGASGKPHEPGAYTGKNHASDFVAVLDALGTSAADVVGYSMGGMIALAAAFHYHARVKSAVVIAAHPFAQDMSPYRRAIADGLETWLAIIEGQGVRLSDASRRRILANDVQALRACVARDRPDASAALPAFHAPLLAMAGTEDTVFGAVCQFAERTGSHFRALEGRNHITSFLAVDEVTAAVEDFLRLETRTVGPSVLGTV